MTEKPAAGAALAHPSFKAALRFWLKLGFISFGGPTGQIAIMHTELVEKKRWIGEERFLHALNYCMLLPGPEAQQLAIYCGWLLHRTRGGLVAGVLFVLPSAFILWGLSYVYVTFGNVPWIAAIFHGLKPAVLAIVATAVLRIGGKALKNAVMWSLAVLAFIAIFFFHAPFPAIIIAAALIGYLGGLRWEKLFNVVKGHGVKSAGGRGAVIDDTHAAPAHTKPSLGHAVRVLSVGLVLWWLPVLCAGLAQGRQGTLAQEGLFSARRPWSLLAALTPCCPTSPSRPWKISTGSPPRRCSTAWAWPKPRRDRSSWCCNLPGFSAAGIIPAACRRFSPPRSARP